MRQLFALPGYTRWFAARCIGWFGEWLLMLVLSMWVKTITGSNTAAGATFIFFMLPQLFAPFLGFLIDRWPTRLTLVIGHIFSALIMVPLLFVSHGNHAYVIYIVTFLYGISNAFLPNASMAMQRTLVPTEMLKESNALQSTMGTIFQLLGPILGGGLFAAAGGWLPAAVCMVCFLVAAYGFWSFKNAPQAARVDGDKGLLKEMSAGLDHIRGNRLILHTFVSAIIFNLSVGMILGSIYSVMDVFGKPATFMSVMVAIQASGMILGALLSRWLVTRFGEVRAMEFAFLVGIVIILAMALAPNLQVYLILLVMTGLIMPVVQVAGTTVQQRLTEPGLMGRVSAATGPFYGLSSSLSMAVGAMLVGVWTFRPVYFLVALGSLAAFVYLHATLGSRKARPAAARAELPPAPVRPSGDVQIEEDSRLVTVEVLSPPTAEEVTAPTVTVSEHTVG